MFVVLILLVVTWFDSFIQFSACLTWTKYPDPISSVWNGSKVELQWDYNLTTAEQNALKTSYSLFWKRGNLSHLDDVVLKTFNKFVPPEVIVEPLKPRITISRSETATLIINDVRKEDEGVYKFILLITSASSRNTTLHVKVQPTIQCPKIVKVIQGEQAIISCNVTGDPTPNITWIRESHFGNVISLNSTLVINNVLIYDGGMYKITANNGRNTIDVVKLEILFAPWMTNLTIESNPKNTTVLLNSSLTLLCVTNANPPPLYHLYLNESNVGNSDSGEFNITAEGDGVYTCVPINTVGTGNNDTLNITAVVPPSVEISNKTATVVEEGRLNFTCTASGKPEPKIAWTKVGSATVIADTPSVSVIVDRPGTADNMIQYQCTASNGVKTPATATVNITVYYKPSAPVSSKTIDVEVGGDKSIPCLEVIGNPAAAISWYRGNTTSGDNITNNLDLDFKSAAESDAGWYTCFAKNVFGNATVKLLVRVVPRKTPLTVPSTTPATCPKTPSEHEFLGKAVIKANCSERLQVATEFPNMCCGLLSEYDCEDGKSCNSSCGSVVVYFILKFRKAISGNQVVGFLKEKARLNKFGRLKVDHESIIQIPSPTTFTTSPTTLTASPSEESCRGSTFKDETCKLKGLFIGLLVGGGSVGCGIFFLIVWCKCKPKEGVHCWICCRRNGDKCPNIHCWICCRTNGDKCPNSSVSPAQLFSSNRSFTSGGNPREDESSGYHKSGPLSAVDTVVVGKEVMVVGGEAIPTHSSVDKSKKKSKKKEHKPIEDQYALVDKSKKKKKKNEPDATYAEVDMSKKSIKKQKPGEVLYADLGEFHPKQKMPEVSTSPKTLPPVKLPEAYAETQYADITQFLKGSPEDTGAEPPKDSTTSAVSNSATGGKEESSAGNVGDVEEAINETGF